MAIPITIPRLGWNMEEGTFGGWLKSDGDEIRPGDRLFVFESEKAAEEIETLDAGLLRIDPDGVKVGDVVPVGKIIGYLAAAGEIVDFFVAAAAEARPAASEVQAESPRVRSADMGQAISPRARRVANELGVDWANVRGTGRGGRIRERDIRSSSASLPSPTASEGRLLHISPRRRTIATRMLESQRATAPVTLTTTVDATNLVRLRNLFKSQGGDVPSYTDFIVLLCAAELAKHPLLAGKWTDEGIQIPKTFDIGIAVDTKDGLRVPVIRDVASLTALGLAKRSRELIDRARAGKLAAAEMQGGCFTVSNLGGFGIDAFTPIINYPECAVLGVGRIARRPAVVGDTIVPRDQLTLSLTFDHRIVDGAPAARFLQSLAAGIENIGGFQ
jgi:pyruvate dehydrogenase E2 component (dihydrolipoamide acetyltransferase)